MVKKLSFPIGLFPKKIFLIKEIKFKIMVQYLFQLILLALQLLRKYFPIFRGLQSLSILIMPIMNPQFQKFLLFN